MEIEAKKLWPWWGHSFLCAIWIVLAFEFSRQQTGIDLLGFQALLFFTMVPVVALIAHHGAVRRTMLLAALKPTSGIEPYLWGTVLRTFLASCLAALMCGVLVMQMLLPETRQPLFRGLASQAAFVVLLLPVALRWMQRHFQPWSQVNLVQQVVVLTGGMVGALAMTLLVPLPSVPALEQALKTTPFSQAPLLDVLAMSQSVIEGLQRMALAEASALGGQPEAAANLLYFLLWLPPSLASAGAFVALGVRPSEMRRAFARPQPSDSPGPVAWGAVGAVLLAGATFWALHHYLWAPLDLFVAQKQIPQQARKAINVIGLNGRYYPADSVKLLIATRPDLSVFKAQARKLMCDNAAKAFISARVQSGKYVDYYYSMPAAVMRTGLAFSDRIDADDAIKEDIQRRVFDSSFQKLMTAGAATVQQAGDMASSIDQKWLQGAEKSLVGQEVAPSDGITLNVVAEAPDLGKLTRAPNEIMDPRWQAATAVASGLLAKGGIDALAGTASKSIANTSAIKGFLSGLSKKVPLGGRSKATVEVITKWTARAATGVIGATAGTAVGVLVTKGELELDERLHRKDFEAQMRREIDHSEIGFRSAAQCASVNLTR